MRTVFRIAIIFVLLFVFCCCSLKLYGEPAFIDRSVDWNVSVMDWETFYYRDLSADDPLFQSFLFEDSHISADHPTYISFDMDDCEVMEFALQEAFQNQYINTGTETPEMTELKNSCFIVYTGGETCVIVERGTGRVVQCVDKRIQKRFDVDDDFLDGSFAAMTDLAQLSEEDLSIYNHFARNIRDATLPSDFYSSPAADASEAFEAAKGILYNRYTTGPLTNLGKNWYVYSAEKSNCWLIVSNNIILMLDKETGKNLLFVTFLSQKCKDLSVSTRR